MKLRLVPCVLIHDAEARASETRCGGVLDPPAPEWLAKGVHFEQTCDRGGTICCTVYQPGRVEVVNAGVHYGDVAQEADGAEPTCEACRALRHVPLVVTTHACRRFVERVRPGTVETDARTTLADAFARARRDGDERTHRGHALWVVDDPPMRLVTKHDHGSGVVLVTVLEPEAAYELDPDEELSAPLPPLGDVLRAERAAREEREGEASRRRMAENAAKHERDARLARLRTERDDLGQRIAATAARMAQINEAGRTLHASGKKLPQHLIDERKRLRAVATELQAQHARAREAYDTARRGG